MEDSVFYSGPSFNVVSDNVGLVTRKENYAKQILSISSLVSYWRLGDYAAAQNYSQMIIADRPTFYWRLNDTGGTVVDRVGGNTGTVTGTITRSVPGAIADGDTSMTFDGVTGFITTASPTVPIPNSLVFLPWSVEYWIKTTSVAQQPVISNRIAGSTGELYFGFQTSKTFLYWISTNSSWSAAGITANKIINDNVWHHTVFTFDGLTVKIYIDGTLDTSQPVVSGFSSGWSSGGTGVIGRDIPNNQFLTGSVDEPAIYPYALTSSQIAKHYATGIGKYAMTVLGDTPLAYWRLGEAAGAANVTDSVFGFTATTIGGVTFGVTGATTETNTAVTLNGTTGYFESLGFRAVPATTITLEAWVNHNGVAWSASHEMTQFYPTAQAHYLSVNNGNMFLSLTLNGIQATASGPAVPITGWHHLVATYDGAAVVFYLDGVPTAGGPYSGRLQTNVGSAVLGNGAGSFFNGSLDEIAIYSNALTAQQVAQHYAAGQGKYADAKITNSGTPNGTGLGKGKGLLPSDVEGSLSINPSVASYLDIGPATNINFNGTAVFTVEVWIYPTTLDGGPRRIIDHDSTVARNGWTMWVNTITGVGFERYIANGGGGSVYSATALIKPNALYHLVVTGDGGLLRLYVNGVFNALGAQAASGVPTTNAVIGTDPTRGAATTFGGLIDEVAIYNAVLSPQQILANYNTGVSSPGRLIDIYGA